MKVGDLFKLHVKINSVGSKSIVSKLISELKDSLLLQLTYKKNSVEVHTYDDPTLSKRKYNNT